MSRRLILFSLSILLSSLLFSMTDNSSQHQAADSLTAVTQGCDLMMLPTDTILTLTEADFEEVAAELGVEVAAIKAVVEIEAGRTHEGFASPGKPLINFDLSMFRRFATRRGVNLSKYSKSHSVVFASSRGSQSRAHKRQNLRSIIMPLWKVLSGVCFRLAVSIGKNAGPRALMTLSAACHGQSVTSLTCLPVSSVQPDL